MTDNPNTKDLSGGLDELLDELSKEYNTSREDVLRKALDKYAFTMDEEPDNDDE